MQTTYTASRPPPLGHSLCSFGQGVIGQVEGRWAVRDWSPHILERSYVLPTIAVIFHTCLLILGRVRDYPDAVVEGSQCFHPLDVANCTR